MKWAPIIAFAILLAGCATTPERDCSDGYWVGCDNNPDALHILNQYGLYQFTNSSNLLKPMIVADGRVAWIEAPSYKGGVSAHMATPGKYDEQVFYWTNATERLVARPMGFDGTNMLLGFGPLAPEDWGPSWGALWNGTGLTDAPYFRLDGHRAYIDGEVIQYQPQIVKDQGYTASVNVITGETIPMDLTTGQMGVQPGGSAHSAAATDHFWESVYTGSGYRTFEFNRTTGEGHRMDTHGHGSWACDADAEHLLIELTGDGELRRGFYAYSRSNHTFQYLPGVDMFGCPILAGDYVAYWARPNETHDEAIWLHHIPSGTNQYLIPAEKGLWVRGMDGDKHGIAFRLLEHNPPNEPDAFQYRQAGTGVEQLYWYPFPTDERF